MRGEQRESDGLFSYIRLEDRIAVDHPLRAIRALEKGRLQQISRTATRSDPPAARRPVRAAHRFATARCFEEAAAAEAGGRRRAGASRRRLVRPAGPPRRPRDAVMTRPVDRRRRCSCRGLSKHLSRPRLACSAAARDRAVDGVSFDIGGRDARPRRQVRLAARAPPGAS